MPKIMVLVTLLIILAGSITACVTKADTPSNSVAASPTETNARKATSEISPSINSNLSPTTKITPTQTASIGEFSIYSINENMLDNWRHGLVQFPQVELRDKPWLTINDIDYYDFNRQFIFLKKDLQSTLENNQSELAKDKYFYQIPFIVVANGEKIYLGVFSSNLSSWIITTPTIVTSREICAYSDELKTYAHPENIIIITPAPSAKESGIDVRKDLRIAQALKQSGKSR